MYCRNERSAGGKEAERSVGIVDDTDGVVPIVDVSAVVADVNRVDAGVCGIADGKLSMTELNAFFQE